MSGSTTSPSPPTVTIPPNAQQITVSFSIGPAVFANSTFQLFTASKSPSTVFGPFLHDAANSFKIPGNPSSLRGQYLDWNVSIFAYAAAKGQPYSIDVQILADGNVISDQPFSGSFPDNSGAAYTGLVVFA